MNNNNKIPTGTVTFLFTDIEGSTRLAQEFPDTLQAALEKHHSILRKAVESNNGFVFEIIGDAFCCAFANALDAVSAAVDIQQNLAKEKWLTAGQAENDAAIKIRIGIHSGKAEWNEKRYLGYIALAKTARVMAVAYGGQILVSDIVFESSKEKASSKITFRYLGERRLKDLNYPVGIYQVETSGLNTDFPPLKTLDARPNNLPVQLTSFIGRENEISEIKKLLKHNSLLTLTGPGGAGKTRLALQVGADLIDDFENGVWVVDASPLLDPCLLVPMIAKVFGMKEDSKTKIEEILIDYLKDKEVLIIMDNCEQIISASSEISTKILSSCKKIKIIASSREALRSSGEQIYYVPSLAFPDSSDEISTENLSQYESVKLFIERALAVQPDFEVTNDNAPALAEICRQLDGIPLAIELAASRVKVLSLQQIYERLSDRFRFLTSGVRTALPRQQTLKAMVDWSYDLLSKKEKLLFNRLSVFSDGWTIEAAEEVCSDEPLKDYEVLDTLSQLMDKSLVVSAKRNTRYRMLETIRQYGEDKLIQSNELDTVIFKHLEYYLKFAESARKELEGESQKEWMDRLESENFNFRVALTSSIARGQREKGILLAIALSRYWETRGYISEGKNYLEELIKTDEELAPELRAKTFQWLGTFEWITGEYEQSQQYYEQSFSHYEKTNDKRGIGVSYINLGLIANARGDFEKSKYLTEEGCRIFYEVGDDHLVADSLLNLGAPLVSLKENDYARMVFEECLMLYRKLHDSRGIAMALTNLGLLAALKNDNKLARVNLEESLSILRELKEKRAISMTLDNLGSIMSLEGYNSTATEYLEESLKISTELGNKKGLADSNNNLGFIKYTEGEHRLSLSFHTESLKLRKELIDKLGIVYSLTGIAQAISKTDPEKAAMLSGAIETSFRLLNYVPSRQIQDVLDETKSNLKEKLSDEKYIELLENGKGISQEEAVELALS